LGLVWPHATGHCELTRDGMKSIRGARRRNAPLGPAQRLADLKAMLDDMKASVMGGVIRPSDFALPKPVHKMAVWRWLRSTG
jgi:hypothetical protein